MTVAIIGMGVVGKAQADLFRPGYSLVTYDIANGNPYPAREIAACEMAVIAVGTPQLPGGHANLDYVLAALGDLPPHVPALVRSTLPPGTTNRLQAVNRNRLIAHAPEFLTERPGAGRPKSSDVPFLILGGGEVAREYFRRRIETVFGGAIHECTAIEAELAKYTANLYWASRVTFVNEMSQICAAFGADWAKVREAWLEDARIHYDYTAMSDELGPGFGGACWPKDLAALIAASISAGYDPLFLEDIEAANARFRGSER
jgi:UDPglucose 6-dehydrogenase